MVLSQEEPGGATATPGFSRSRFDLPVKHCPRCFLPFWTWEEYYEHAWHEKP